MSIILAVIGMLSMSLFLSVNNVQMTLQNSCWYAFSLLALLLGFASFVNV